jgi:hypothetical protein
MNPTQINLRKLNLTRRVIYLLVAVAVVVPCIIKIPLPGQPNHWAEEVFRRFEALKSGSRVLLSFDFDPSAQAEMYPMSKAVLRHCFRKGLVPVVMTHWPSGINLAKELCESASAENRETVAAALRKAPFPAPRASLIAFAGKQGLPPGVLRGVQYVLSQVQDRTYANLAELEKDRVFTRIPGNQLQAGQDYVLLGFRPGGSMLILQMGENLKGAFERDVDQRPTQSMPALQGINSLRDIDLAMDFAAGASVEMWIAYGSDRFNFPLAAGTTAVQAPDLYTWLQSKQLVGFLGGLRGAADYETLLEMPDEAIAGMPPQSAAHVLLVVLILGANVRMIAKRFTREPEDAPHA